MRARASRRVLGELPRLVGVIPQALARNRLRNMSQQMVTMGDVARLAGVSITTVSHVLNGTRPASAAATRRVMEAVERTGYTPNTIARALARASTQSLGLAISGLANPYFTDLIAAVEREAGRAGHTLLLGDTREDADQELRMVQALLERRVVGASLSLPTWSKSPPGIRSIRTTGTSWAARNGSVRSNAPGDGASSRPSTRRSSRACTIRSS